MREPRSRWLIPRLRTYGEKTATPSSWMCSSATVERNGFTWKDLVSGALLSSLVERAKDFAIKRAIDSKQFENAGITEGDLQKAVTMEFKENEIFPKSDAVEDWLMLLDQAPENVADVKPIRAATRGQGSAKAPTGVI